MTKYSRKSNKRYIKDKAIIKFIKAHSKRQNIDFSKIKIPSFLDISEENEEKEGFLFSSPKNIFVQKKDNQILGRTIIPAFRFQKKNLELLDFKKSNNESSINSLLFN